MATPPPLPGSQRRRRIWAKFFVALVLLLLPVVLWLYISPDEPPPDVSDFTAKPRQLPNDQNAYAIIMQAAALVTTDLFKANSDQLNDMTKGKNWDAPLARTWLDGTDAIWPLWEQAARTPQGQAPSGTAVGYTNSDVQAINNLNKLAQIRAWDLAHNGKPDAAIEFLFTTLQVAQRLEQSRGDPIYYHIATGIRGTVLNSLRGITTEFKPPAVLLRQTLRQMEANRPGKEAFANLLRGEYRGFSHGLENPEAAYFGSKDVDEGLHLYVKISTYFPYFFHPNQTRRIYAEAIRNSIGAIDLPTGYPGDLRNIDNLRKILSGFHGNNLGLALLVASVPFQANELDMRLTQQSRLSANEAFLALVLYHRDHGELPATLDTLVPDYLPAVPRDYFDGQPIRYSRDFRAVWSVGNDHFAVTSADLDPEEIAHHSDNVCLPLDFAAPVVDPPPAPATARPL